MIRYEHGEFHHHHRCGGSVHVSYPACSFRLVRTQTASAKVRALFRERTASRYHRYFDRLLSKKRQSAEFSKRHPLTDFYCSGSGFTLVETEHATERRRRDYLLYDTYPNRIRVNLFISTSMR